MLDSHAILIDTVAQQARALAEHHGHPFDAAAESAVRHEAQRTLANRATAHDLGPASGIPSWLAPILKSILAALLAGMG